MLKGIRTLVIVVLVIAMGMTSASSLAEASSKHYVGNSEKLPRYPEGTSEKEAGILTEEASNEIKRLIQQQGLTNIESLLGRYFNHLVKDGFYDDSANTDRAANSKSGSDTPIVPEGTTKYTVEYDNTGIFTYRSRGGIYSSIVNATISMYLGEIENIGSILSWVYSVLSGIGPNVEQQASAKTMYSYRYVVEKGWVYYCDWTYDYYPRATVVSRDICEHYWGQYVDNEGFARQSTRDLGIRGHNNAQHRGNATWIKNKAKAQWQSALPHYYEDWQ